MAISLSAAQIAECNAIAVDAWHTELRGFLHREFPEITAKQLEDWCQLCRATCTRLQIRSEHGIYAFHILCLRAGQLISSEQSYIDQHVVYMRKFGSADALPIDLLAWVKACGG